EEAANILDGPADSDEEGRSTRGRAILEGVTRSALTRVRSNREAVLHHLGESQSHRRLDRRRPRLAGELEIRRGQDGGRADRLRDNRRGRLDRVRMGL